MTTVTLHAPQDYGRVAVLLGGRSGEREISLQSGRAVCAALRRCNIDAHPLDPRDDGLQALTGGQFDRVCIMLHGRGGEDGSIQGMLESLDLPYTGSGVLGAAVSMDKAMTKRVWQAQGLPTPPFIMLDAANNATRFQQAVGVPAAIKPVHEGSSLGMTRLTDAAQLDAAQHKARQYHDEVMAERWIDGAEYTASILDDQALPIIRLKTPHEFYDFDAKYRADSTQYDCPCGLDAARERELGELCLRAFHAVGASGWGRVDFMLDDNGAAWLLEVNAVPGMTDHSLVPMAARQAGINFDALCERILATSLTAAHHDEEHYARST